MTKVLIEEILKDSKSRKMTQFLHKISAGAELICLEKFFDKKEASPQERSSFLQFVASLIEENIDIRNQQERLRAAKKSRKNLISIIETYDSGASPELLPQFYKRVGGESAELVYEECIDALKLFCLSLDDYIQNRALNKNNFSRPQLKRPNAAREHYFIKRLNAYIWYQFGGSHPKIIADLVNLAHNPVKPYDANLVSKLTRQSSSYYSNRMTESRNLMKRYGVYKEQS